MCNKKNIVLYLGLLTFASVNANVINENSKINNLSDTAKVFDIDEIVIVSQPKETLRLRNQALSSSIFGKGELNSLKVKDLRELSAYVPAFTMPNYGARLTSSMYVRGLGSRVNSPAMGIYVDGAPLMSKAIFNQHFYDVDRVDVLRGSQGTLYGQNTEGGLVKVYTKNPMNYQGTDVKLGWGTRSYRNAELSHYIKVNDRIALSVAGFYNGQNGFFRNTHTGKRADDYNEAGGRFRFIARPTECWTADLIGEYQYVDQNGFPYGQLNIENNRVSSPSTTFQSKYRRNIVNTSLNLTHHGNGIDFSSVSSYQYLKDNMLMDQDYLAKDLLSLNQRQYQNAFTQEFSVKGNLNNVWRSTTGAFMSLQWLKTNSPVNFGSDFTTPIANATSQQMYNAILNAQVARMVAQGMPQAAAEAQARNIIERAGGISMNMDLRVPGVFRTPEFNLGFYHESNINITSRLMATLGLRYDFHRARVDYQTAGYWTSSASVMGQRATTVLSSVYNSGGETKSDQLLPKFALTYNIGNSGSNIYALVSKGYRAGGFNIQMFSDIIQSDLMANRNRAQRSDYAITDHNYNDINNAIVYKPETSWNYELGTHLNLFDNKLHFDLSTYYMRISNQQLSVMSGNYGFGRMMVNAGKSESYGLEATLRGIVFGSNLSYSISYGYTHAKFKEYKDQIRNSSGTLDDISYKGKYVPYMPQHTLSAMADYTFNFNSNAINSIVVGANVAAQGKTYWDINNSYSQKFYAVLGAHADANFKFVTLSVWARNLTKTRYNVFAFDSAASRQRLYFAQMGNPIQMGVDLSFHF